MPSILDHPIISSRYFFPRRAEVPRPVWVECDGARLACYSHRPHPGAKTILHFHGNGEVVSDYLPDFPVLLEQLGYNCFLAEYRGYGMSSGTPAMAGMLADVERIIAATGRPPEELILFGRSVGSIYALHGAFRVPQVAGLIIESGIADPLDRLLLRLEPDELGVTLAQLEAAVAQELNHQQKLSHYHGPTLIMHTRYDGLVELSHAERLYAWASSPKRLKIFERGNHNTILWANHAEYFQTVQQFIVEEIQGHNPVRPSQI
jgi:hypothetical protein